jgi:hypothetical protein
LDINEEGRIQQDHVRVVGQLLHARLQDYIGELDSLWVGCVFIKPSEPDKQKQWALIKRILIEEGP